MDIQNIVLLNNFPKELIEFMVFIPILATLVSVGRYIFGLKTLGIYTPIVLAIAFVLTGIKEGLVLTAIVIIGAFIGHKLLSKIRMHYITRVAANYAILATLIIAIMLTLNLFNIANEYTKDINPLGLLLISTLSDSFIKMYVKKNLVTTFRSFFETIAISVLGWFIITTESIVGILISNIWIVPILIIFNVLLGQFVGFRFKELFRFKSVPKDDRKNFGNK